MTSQPLVVSLVSSDDDAAMATIASLDAKVRGSAWTAQSWAATLSGTAAAMVAHLDGEAVGFAAFVTVFEQGELLMVGVDPQFQRRGIARKLLQEGVAQVRWLGATAIHLEVASRNEGAIALYESMGYERRGLRRAYYPDGDDAVLMTLHFAVCAG